MFRWSSRVRKRVSRRIRVLCADRATHPARGPAIGPRAVPPDRPAPTSLIGRAFGRCAPAPGWSRGASVFWARSPGAICLKWQRFCIAWATGRVRVRRADRRTFSAPVNSTLNEAPSSGLRSPLPGVSVPAFRGRAGRRELNPDTPRQGRPNGVWPHSSGRVAGKKGRRFPSEGPTRLLRRRWPRRWRCCSTGSSLDRPCGDCPVTHVR
jgi:hypothetical protein